MASSPSERSKRNLKRGNIEQTDSWSKARDARVENRAALDDLEDIAHESPDDAILELFAEASRAAARGLRKWNKRGGEPSRQSIEATKEARQLAISAADILRSRGRAAEAESFFAQVEARIAAADLDESVQPYHCSKCGAPA